MASDNIITKYMDAPDYQKAKEAQLTQTYETKSFKTYLRPAATSGDRFITDDDVDQGGFSNEDGS